MKLLKWFICSLILLTVSVHAQHTLHIDAVLNPETQSLSITQQITFVNTSETSISEIYLLDWANSFSSKTTPLAERFAENFNSSFHFEKEENRGKTTITYIQDHQNKPLVWNRDKGPDLINITLEEILPPKGEVVLHLSYTVKVPNDKFTRFGVSKYEDYKLRYWFMAPAVFDGEWQAYSNKNVEDFYMSPSRFLVNFHFPKEYTLVSDLDIISETVINGNKIVHLEGNNRMNVPIYLDKNLHFNSVVTDNFELQTDLRDKKVTPAIKALQIDRITHFLEEKLGPYPFEKMVISDADYRNNPVYGLNQLPDFISPFPNGFEMDMELLKTMTRKFLENTLYVNPREDHWLLGALQTYLMMEYVNTYYPDTKLIGNLSEFLIIRWSHVSTLEFNDQYPLLYLNMARSNLHQSLKTTRDSLIKFNKNIASDYYAGAGFGYLSDYLGKEALDTTISEFYQNQLLQPTNTQDFQEALSKNTSLPINWFFEDYVGKRTLIDFKIKKVTSVNDSLIVTIRNKENNAMPVSLYGLDKNDIVFKKWIQPFDSSITVTVPKEKVKRLALNYEASIPEMNQRNNFKKVTAIFNKPLQFRLFQDVEDPKYNQLFFMPVFQYNLYDGFSLGMKLYNKTLLPKDFNYRLEPQFGFRSKTIVGSGSFYYTSRYDHQNLYSLRTGIAGTYFSYDEDLFYKRISPYITFAFRDHKDLRKNTKQYINLRNVNVSRDENPLNPNQEPNYNVYNAQYVYIDNNLTDYYRGLFDFQVSKKFSKASLQLEYRKLFLSNRQLNLRFFSGIFLNNKTETSDDYFSYALDRPSDYLFDYNYYGRSEDTGLFSQQLIIAEGGFKSKLQPAYANQWITTLNASTNIWKWIYAYADAGIIKNTGFEPEFVYDTGVRASLVADYFELYFPLYSNLGWEPGLGNYDQRIRFIVTLDIKTLLGLFTRKWY
ncbi:MAG: metalloprotease [Flavobacteriaceae bacterium]